MLSEKAVMSLTEGLSILNEEIKKEKSTMDILWRTVQYQTSRLHSNSQPLEEVLDSIYGPPVGDAIEILISNEDKDGDLKEYIVENKSYYLSLRENFQYAYLASVRSYNISPYALMNVESVTADQNLFRFMRVDGSYMDLDLDVSSFMNLNNLTIIEMLLVYREEATSSRF
ncbi:hypothetical protein NZ043_27680 [Paenibacillus sp. FSL k6-2145]|uniref:hypothetical protein n=1 Tax=Paenibacillus sp. FSL k6-2145 TaxID=2976834 RepID=UPI0030DCBA23